MSDATATRLWTPDGFQDDEWQHAEGADALGGNGSFILPLAAFLALSPAEREAHAGRLGVKLLPGETLEAVLPFLDALPLVALAFPAFSDGRSFSKAELLRTRHGYAGTIRATGQVLVDQFPHMLRLGFDAFEISNPTLLARLEKGETGGIPLHYQPAVVTEAPGETYSWRRVSKP
ncbi:MAG: hypothetical protein DI629_00255 [Mesorhizobium amorphae]|nr:MAG: hypothetical protein DI629_00255 [Mesorhizobium amorphae]